jgi:hypothetical protein
MTHAPPAAQGQASGCKWACRTSPFDRQTLALNGSACASNSEASIRYGLPHVPGAASTGGPREASRRCAHGHPAEVFSYEDQEEATSVSPTLSGRRMWGGEGGEACVNPLDGTSTPSAAAAAEGFGAVVPTPLWPAAVRNRSVCAATDVEQSRWAGAPAPPSTGSQERPLRLRPAGQVAQPGPGLCAACSQSQLAVRSVMHRNRERRWDDGVPLLRRACCPTSAFARR